MNNKRVFFENTSFGKLYAIETLLQFENYSYSILKNDHEHLIFCLCYDDGHNDEIQKWVLTRIPEKYYSKLVKNEIDIRTSFLKSGYINNLITRNLQTEEEKIEALTDKELSELDDCLPKDGITLF